MNENVRLISRFQLGFTFNSLMLSSSVVMPLLRSSLTLLALSFNSLCLAGRLVMYRDPSGLIFTFHSHKLSSSLGLGAGGGFFGGGGAVNTGCCGCLFFNMIISCWYFMVSCRFSKLVYMMSVWLNCML